MNKYIENLGASTDWGFHDIFGLDPDLLMMVPKPVAAVMLLYPISEKVCDQLSLFSLCFDDSSAFKFFLLRTDE